VARASEQAFWRQDYIIVMAAPARRGCAGS
jgi:hypothetical protein